MTIKDTNGLNKPINYEGILPDTNMSVNPFGQNKAAEIAYKKAERLVLATHLVTNFVPKNENVRENIRTSSQELLPHVMKLRSGFQSAGTGTLATIVAKARHIVSLLDLVHASGYISNMNTEVLKNAYVDLVRFLYKSKDAAAAEALELEDGVLMSVIETSQGHNKGHFDKGQKESIKDKNIKDIKTVTDTKPEKTKRTQSLRSKRRTANRRMAILDIITKKSPIHIRDIAAEITDCSEKTIQRELGSLVRDGVVKREGSKRWTLYSLVV